jgi:hypothetical protein
MAEKLYFRIVNYQYYELRVVDIETGTEFVADDIFRLVSPFFCLSVITDKIRSKYLETIPAKFRRKRTIYIADFESEVEVDTLCWLALKHVFKIYDYKNSRQFIKFLRHEVVANTAL